MAGQDEARFWDQTPRTFQAVLDGAQRRERRANELATFGAWQGQRFAREKTLRGFGHYLKELQPPEPKEVVARRTIDFVRSLKRQAEAAKH